MQPARHIALLLLAACSFGRDPYEGSLSDNVGEAFASCNEAEIKFLASKHNVQLAFAPCATNKFSAYAWSPDGLRIYFQLVLSANVMEADRPDRRTVTLPIPAPVGSAVWLGNQRIVAPIVADAEHDGVLRMAIFDLPGEASEQGAAVVGQYNVHDVPGFVSIDQLARGDAMNEVLFVGRKTKDGPGSVYRLDTTDGTVTPAFAWLSGPVDTFTYTPAAHATAIGVGDHVTLYDATTGAVQGGWDDARRGVLHPNGRWLALEFDAAPVSVFHQRGWDEVSEQARKREQARADAFAERLPKDIETTVRPPSLSLVDRTSGRRVAITAFQGDHFQWYDAASTWGSFFTWGFESKQYKRNVGLINLVDHLQALDEGRVRYGTEAFTSPTGKPAQAPTPAAAEPTTVTPAEEGTPPAAEEAAAPTE